MADKKFYWLKLQDGFFDSKRIKKLRKLAGGDTYTIIYLKMQLVAMKKGGILEYTGLEKTFAEELALELDEEPENVAVTVNYLLSCGLLEASSEAEYFVPYAVMNTGSESSSTRRVREHRERKALQCNTDVTPVKQICNTEKEIEIEKETDTEIEENTSFLPEAETAPAQPKPSVPSSPVVISIILNDKTEYPITEADVDGWKDLYPAVDVLQELRKMKGWADANPTKRKTKAGIKRFINAWLSKEQDRYHGPGNSQQTHQGGGYRNAPPHGADRLLEMIDRGDFDE